MSPVVSPSRVAPGCRGLGRGRHVRDNGGMPARPLVFRPLVGTRVACAVAVALPATLAWGGTAQHADPMVRTLAVPAVVLGVLLAVRAFRMAVIVEARTVTVRGMVRSRTLPRAGVDALHDDFMPLVLGPIPTVFWRQADNTERRTRLWMFGEPQYQFADVTGHNRRTISRLRKLLGISGTGYRRLRG